MRGELWGHRATMASSLPPSLGLEKSLCETRSALKRPHRENNYLHTIVLHVDGKQKVIDPTPTPGDMADNDAVLSLNPTMPKSNVYTRVSTPQIRHP